MVRHGLMGLTLPAGETSIRPFPLLRMASILGFEPPVVKSLDLCRAAPSLMALEGPVDVRGARPPANLTRPLAEARVPVPA
jgi:hypothetical protein